METLLSTRQVQDLLQLDRTTIYRMLKDGRLTGVKVGQQWRFYAGEVNALLAGATRVAGSERQVAQDVLPLNCVQTVQNVFADVAGLGAVTTDKAGEPLTQYSNSCEFCQAVQSSPKGRQACLDALSELDQADIHSNEFVTCHAGLQYAGAGIRVRGELLGRLVAGQFYVQAPDETEQAERVQELAEAYNIDPERLAAAAEDITVLDEHKRSQIWKWLKQVASTFEEISYERASLMSRLKRIAEMSDLSPK